MFNRCHVTDSILGTHIIQNDIFVLYSRRKYAKIRQDCSEVCLLSLKAMHEKKSLARHDTGYRTSDNSIMSLYLHRELFGYADTFELNHVYRVGTKRSTGSVSSKLDLRSGSGKISVGADPNRSRASLAW